MRAFSFEVLTTAQRLVTILPDCARHTGSIAIQAPAANVDTIFFGDQKVQPFELRPKANGLIPIKNVNEFSFYGSVGDNLSVMLND